MNRHRSLDDQAFDDALMLLVQAQGRDETRVAVAEAVAHWTDAAWGAFTPVRPDATGRWRAHATVWNRVPHSDPRSSGGDGQGDRPVSSSVTDEHGSVLGYVLVGSPGCVEPEVRLDRISPFVAAAIESALRLHAARRARDRDDGSLDERATLVRVLRANLVPPKLPAIPGFEIAARYLPMEGEVGGDFYDVQALPGGAWQLTLGDVTGKGVTAAGVASIARHAARFAAAHDAPPSEVIREINRALLAESADASCTVCCVRLHGPDARKATIALGGHPRPLLVRSDGEWEEVGALGTMLGVLDEPSVSDVLVDLANRDVLVLYTDGITESRRDGRFFDSWLSAVLVSSRELTADEIAANIERATSDFARSALSDDMALVVLRAVDS